MGSMSKPHDILREIWENVARNERMIGEERAKSAQWFADHASDVPEGHLALETEDARRLLNTAILGRLQVESVCNYLNSMRFYLP